MTSIVAPILGSVAGSLVTGALFGGKSKSTGYVQPQAPRYGSAGLPISTPSLSFEGGKLTRSDPTVLEEERRIRDLLGTNLQRFAGLAESPFMADSAAITGALGQQIPGLFSNTERLRGQLGGLTGELSDLQAQVQPGFGKLTQAVRESIRNKSLQATGNLKDSLARRGILGSSFADDALSRVERDFAAQEAEATSQAAVGEMQLSSQILTQKMQAVQLAGNLVTMDQNNLVAGAKIVGLRMGLTGLQADLFAQEMRNISLQLQSALAQQNRELQELGVSANISNGLNALALDQAKADAQLAAQAAAGQGAASARLGSSIGEGIGGLFQGFASNPILYSGGGADLGFGSTTAGWW